MKGGFSPKICVVRDNCFLTSYFGNSWAVISLGNVKCVSHWSSLLDSNTKLPLKCTWKVFRGLPHTHKSWAKLNEGLTGLLHVSTISQHSAEQGTKEMKCGRSQGIQEKWWLAVCKIERSQAKHIRAGLKEKSSCSNLRCLWCVLSLENIPVQHREEKNVCYWSVKKSSLPVGGWSLGF